MTTSGYDGSIKIDTSIDGSGFNKGISGLITGLKGLALGIAGAFSVNAIVNFTKQSIQSAETVRMLRGKFDSVFGGLSDTVGKQLGDIETATNFCVDDLKGFASEVQIAFSGMGFAADKAAGMSVEVVKLSTDLAVFNNLPVEQVVSSIQMAMMGMTRGLRQYGITVDDATIKAKAQAMGLWDGAGAMNAQARAAAILQIITQQTAYAQGAAAASTNTWTGQVRGITEAWKDFSEMMGQGFITALMGIMPVVTKILNFMIGIATTFSQLMGILFGITIQTSSASTGLSDAAGAAGDLADNTSAAGKAAKGALAAFDQLNVLQQDQGNAGAGGGDLGGGALGGGAEWKKISDGWFAETWKNVKKWFEDNLSDQAIIKWITEAWGWMTQAAQDALNWIVTVAWPWMTQAAKDALDWMAQAARDAWKWITDAASNALNWIVTVAWPWVVQAAKDAWGWVSQVAQDAWARIVSIWTIAGTWFQTTVIDPIKAAFKTVLDWLGGAWNTVFSGIGLFIIGVVNNVIGYLNRMGQSTVDAINRIITAYNSIPLLPDIGTLNWGGIPTIPYYPPGNGSGIFHLASGAVIPPNSEFAAILGDQRSGRNIEAPEGLIRQIIQEEMGNGNGQRVTVDFGNSSLGALIRTLNPVIKQENDRKGTSLIDGASA
jgi:hypothetical protein